MKLSIMGQAGRWVSVAMLLFCLAVTAAQADNGNRNNAGSGGEGSHSGGGGAPTAPEPGILPMAAGGVILVGCYVGYRLRRRAAGNGSQKT